MNYGDLIPKMAKAAKSFKDMTHETFIQALLAKSLNEDVLTEILTFFIEELKKELSIENQAVLLHDRQIENHIYWVTTTKKDMLGKSVTQELIKENLIKFMNSLTGNLGLVTSEDLK